MTGPEITPPSPMTAARLRRARRRLRTRSALTVAAWTVGFLVAADVGLNLLAPPPPVNVRPERVRGYAVRAYLDYGRSTVGKLARQVQPTIAGGGPLVPIGWVEHGAATPNLLNVQPRPRVRVSAFGMSFSNHVTSAVAAMDPTVAVAQYAGPSAPPNHSFAMYRQVRRMGPAAVPSDVVVFGILASSVKGMLTQTGDTWMFESPAPYCYPRYTLDAAGRLVESWPAVRTEADLRAALADRSKMDAFRDGLAAHDLFYDPVSFGGTTAAAWADHSALARLLRRAWADRHVWAVSSTVDRPKLGFDPDSPDVGRPLRAVCLDFAATARADGKRPVVLLIQDQGSRDHLYQLLGPYLADHGVPIVSTHEWVPTDVRTNFVADGHFTPAADRRVAAALLARINDPATR